MTEIIEIIISSILLLLAFFLFFFKLTRSWLPQWRPPKPKKPEEPEEKPAPAVPVKRGIPGYLKTVIALVVIIAIIALVITNLGQIQQTLPKLGPEMLKNSKAEKISDNETLITFAGEGEVDTLLRLKPGETATATYEGGKVISNSQNKYTVPIWGVHPDEASQWKPLMTHKNMYINAVYLRIGERAAPFKEDSTQVSINNTDKKDQAVFLGFNDAKGYYGDNEGDAKFRIKK